MLDSGLANVTMFFVIIGICLIFIITWILKSEARVSVFRDEIKKVKGDLDASERERFVLSEKITNLEAARRAATGVPLRHLLQHPPAKLFRLRPTDHGALPNHSAYRFTTRPVRESSCPSHSIHRNRAVL